MSHGSYKLHVDDCDELPRLFQTVESTHVHGLADNFIGYLKKFADIILSSNSIITSCYLISPAVNLRQVNIVNKHNHLFPLRGPKGVSHPLVHVALDSLLKLIRSGGAGKVKGTDEAVVRVGFLHVGLHHDSLSRALLSYQQHPFALFGYCVDEIADADIIGDWYEDVGVVWRAHFGIDVVGDACGPGLPFAFVVDHVIEDC